MEESDTSKLRPNTSCLRKHLANLSINLYEMITQCKNEDVRRRLAECKLIIDALFRKMIKEEATADEILNTVRTIRHKVDDIFMRNLYEFETYTVDEFREFLGNTMAIELHDIDAMEIKKKEDEE